MESMGMSSKFWDGKCVLITGHTGFKGSWLILWLKSMGAKVVGYALEAPTEPSLFKDADVGSGIIDIRGDIRDLEHLKTVFLLHRPEIVIHMAAQSLVRYSYTSPVETYSVNVMGTVNVLEAVRCSGTVRAVVNVTSDKCYENKEWEHGYREINRMGGYDPYSNSKGCSELITASYRNSFFNVDNYDKHQVAIASARAGNVIGGGDWAEDRLIPDIMRAIMKGEQVKIRNPHAIRPWQHVLEPLSGYLTLAQSLFEKGSEDAEAWNFGPHESDAKSVEWIVDKLTRSWGGGAAWLLDGVDHPYEANYLKLDCSKANLRLGWFPLWSLETALSSIDEWYKAYFDKKDIRTLTLNQIEKYMNDIQRGTVGG